MQPWRGYTFFQIKVGKERNSGWSSAKDCGIASRGIDPSARGSGDRVGSGGYARGGPEKRGKDAGPVVTVPKAKAGGRGRTTTRASTTEEKPRIPSSLPVADGAGDLVEEYSVSSSEWEEV